jgi:hypothetical protein
VVTTTATNNITDSTKTITNSTNNITDSTKTITNIQLKGLYDRGENRYGFNIGAYYTGDYDGKQVDFTLSILYHKGSNTIDYVMQVYISNRNFTTYVDYISIPETIQLDSDNDRDNMMRMMYSFKEYINYMIKTKGKLYEKIENVGIAINKASENYTKCINGESQEMYVSANRYLGLNPLELYTDMGKLKEHNTKFVVPTYKDYKEYRISVLTTIDIVEKEETVDIMYSTNTYIANGSESREVSHNNIKTITISNIEIELIATANLLERLVTDYHILDSEFMTQMDRIDRHEYEGKS